jgi:outer membrane protein assembly factor BamB
MIRILLSVSVLFFGFISDNQSVDDSLKWPMFRGALAAGVLDDALLPANWDVETGKNIQWKTEIPGLGHSSPVVWGDYVFVTTAVSKADSQKVKAGIYGNVESVAQEPEHEWKLFCIDKHSGAVKWERTAFTGVPKTKRHPMSSHANATPATDGNYVVAFFGSEGLYCYDMKGSLRWKKDFGVLESVFFSDATAEWEFASSPLIFRDRVIIQCDVLKNSFLAAFDIITGKQIWKKERDEYPGWCTPNIYFDGGQARIAVNGFKHRGGYDFETGEEIWKMSGGGDIPIPTPLPGNGLLYFNSAHGRSSPVLAISPEARGDITLNEGQATNEFVKWSIPRGGSYMQTMLLYGDYLYNAGWNGRMVCYHALTGKEMYAQKVGTGNSYTSSPVAADGIIYIADNNGMVYSVKAGPVYSLLAENRLHEAILSTPAIVKGYLFFRTQNHLIAVSAQPK